MRLRRLLVVGVVLVVVAGLVVGVVSGFFGRLVDPGRYASGPTSTAAATSTPTSPAPSSSGAASTAVPEPTTSTSPPATPTLPRSVLSTATPTEPVSAARLAARIRAVKVKGATGSYSAEVRDVGTGKILYAHDARTGRIPASTMKLLTSTAALSILGPDHTFTTSVVSPTRSQIILVGGGDPYLATKTSASTYPERASVAQLAAATATSLKHRRIKRVRLGYDASLFTGPAFNPVWPTSYTDVVTRTSALWVDEGKVNGVRVSDPARAAADAFAQALDKRGISVISTRSARASKSDRAVAEVSSMPVERIVQQLLLVSDNDAAEVMFRQAAVGAGKPGSIAHAKTVVRAELTKLGVWDSSARINDGSGLARPTKVPADTMVKLLRLATQAKHPELRAVVTGLPVAGVEGSLRNRFGDDDSLSGRGLVRAKTGTLNKVHALAGIVRTADGELLVFAFLVNNPANDYNAVVWLDRVTAAISTCGCH